MVRAVVINKTGPPDVLELVSDYEKPEIGDGQVIFASRSSYPPAELPEGCLT